MKSYRKKQLTGLTDFFVCVVTLARVKHALHKPLHWYGAKEAIARMVFVSVFITKERPRRLQPSESD